jgi:hypothetical protein
VPLGRTLNSPLQEEGREPARPLAWGSKCLNPALLYAIILGARSHSIQHELVLRSAVKQLCQTDLDLFIENYRDPSCSCCNGKHLKCIYHSCGDAFKWYALIQKATPVIDCRLRWHRLRRRIHSIACSLLPGFSPRATKRGHCIHARAALDAWLHHSLPLNHCISLLSRVVEGGSQDRLVSRLFKVWKQLFFLRWIGAKIRCQLKGHSDESFLLRILKDSSLCIFKSIVVP